MTTNLQAAINLRGPAASRLLDTMHGEWKDARAQHRASGEIAARNAAIVRAALEKHVSRKPLLRRLLGAAGRVKQRVWG